ncbi:hypothetical protein DFH09DRAFT_1338369 [Mycena vulgaris]|nr:hypothetical protein DFH09DRAFT_1338369 [Mycena vulgaris]
MALLAVTLISSFLDFSSATPVVVSRATKDFEYPPFCIILRPTGRRLFALKNTFDLDSYLVLCYLRCRGDLRHEADCEFHSFAARNFLEVVKDTLCIDPRKLDHLVALQGKNPNIYGKDERNNIQSSPVVQGEPESETKSWLKDQISSEYGYLFDDA